MTTEPLKEIIPKTVLVCVNRRFRGNQPSCAQRGSEEIADAIERGVEAVAHATAREEQLREPLRQLEAKALRCRRVV